LPLLVRRCPGFWRFLEPHLQQARILDPFAREQFFDGENLNAGIAVFESGRLVESGFGGFFAAWAWWALPC